jgi:peptide/nickel transport system permease protein
MNLAAYVIRRILVAVLLLVGLTFITFLLYDLTPIDPACVVAGCDIGARPLDPAQKKLIYEAIGVDQPLTTQYVEWAKGVLHGDLGLAWQGLLIDPEGGLFGTSVSQVVIPAMWQSLSVVIGGIVLLLAFVVPIAALGASRPGSWFDRVTAALLLIGISTHPLVVGLILQSVSRSWTAVPWGGYCSIHAPEGEAPPVTTGAGPVLEPCHGIHNWAWHLLLPWLTFSIFFAALYVRVLRTTLIEVLDEPYIATARAKGASEARVMFRHALRNAMRPILTMTAMEAGMAVSVLLYIEVVFGINGLGRVSLTAFSGDVGYDRQLIAALVLFIGIAIIGLNLLVDLLYPLIDPRVTVGRERSRLVVGPAA